MLLTRLKISGHSMEPQIRNGDFVLASSIPYFFSKPRKGDIVVFKKERRLIIKRIDQVKNYKYKVLGDNKKDSLDFGWITRIDILGKVFKI